MKLAIGINIFGKYDRQDHCIQTLIKLSEQFKEISLYNITFKECVNEHPQFTHLPFLKKYSKDVAENIISDIPISKEFFDILSQQDCDYFMYLNSDVLPSKKLIKMILKGEYETYSVSRHDVLPIKNITDDIRPFRIEIAGFDAWICKKEWWLKNNNLFKDYIIGNHLWDVDYALTMFINSKGKLCNKEFYLAHEKHQIKWTSDSPEALYNSKLFDKNSFKEKWSEFIWKNLVNRPPYGSFLTPLYNEEELEIKYFKNE
jgi:hypothetical protein